jgi:hypothetical protein
MTACVGSVATTWLRLPFSFSFSFHFSLLINFLACQKIKIKNYYCDPGSMWEKPQCFFYRNQDLKKTLIWFNFNFNE